jgi:hypothetical protein
MKTKALSRRLFFAMGLHVMLGLSAMAQPYVDPFQVRYMYGFRQPHTDATPFAHLWAGSDLPVRLAHDRLLLISPTYEMWNLDSADVGEAYPPVHSLTLPVGLILPIEDSKWTLTFIPMIRTNGEKLFAENTFQAAGVALAAFARRPQQKIRFGVYVSGEFFGLFVIPLLGVDWRIDDKNYLFGVLPGRLTFEHKWSDRFYVGATFRAPTNSYRLSNGGFIRLDDNQASLFLDYYPVRQVCITLEPGIGVFRRLRIGGEGRDYIREADWGDGAFIKLSGAYRIRFQAQQAAVDE